MRHGLMESFNGFKAFLGYFVVSCLMLLSFIEVYIQTTKYMEVDLIRRGNRAAAIALAGAIFGFVLPMGWVMKQSVNLVDMVLWGSLASAVQLLTYKAVEWSVPSFVGSIEVENEAYAVTFAAFAIAVGVLNAMAMTY